MLWSSVGLAGDGVGRRTVVNPGTEIPRRVAAEGGRLPRPCQVGSCHHGIMCRNIRVLHNFAPPASQEEIQGAALQYVRKISGTNRPSTANQEAFDAAVAEVADATRTLLDRLVTRAPPRDREIEAEKARARAAQRYG